MAETERLKSDEGNEFPRSVTSSSFGHALRKGCEPHDRSEGVGKSHVPPLPLLVLAVAPIPSLALHPPCPSLSRKTPRLRVSLLLGNCLRRASDGVHSDRVLAYKPLVSSKAKPGPVRLNTKGKAPSGRNVGKLTDLLKMPLDVFYEVFHSDR